MFDKNKFSQILKNINDTYESQRDFSKKSEINRTYLSQYMNMKLDDPPKPKILQKLADASNGITTYSELMIICGYLNDEFKNFNELSEKLAKSKAYIDCFNLLSTLKLSETEITQILYEITAIDIEKIGNNEEELKKAVLSILEKFSKNDKELGKIIISQYWSRVLEYRKEAEKFLLNKEKELYDPLGLAQIGFSMDNYTPPTDAQREQIKGLLEVILKDNKKDKSDK